MLKLVDLNKEYFKEGNCQGLQGLVFKFEDDGQQFEIPKGSKEPTKESLVTACEAILENIKAKLEEKKLEQDWIDFLLAKNYGFFIGDDLANKNCIDESTVLFAMISHISHDLQKEETVEFRKRPPMFAFKGKGLNYTGLKQFYENFNFVLVECTPEKPENMFAFLEITKNIFANIQCVCKSVKDVETFYQNYVVDKTSQVVPNRVSIIIEDLTNAKELIEKAFELGIRSQISYKAVGFIEGCL